MSIIVSSSKSSVSSLTSTVILVPSGVTILTTTHYSWGTSLNIQNTNGTSQEFEITITGSTYEVEGRRTIEVEDTASINANGRQELEWKPARFLQTVDQAESIASTILASYKDPQKDVSVSLENNGNPALELGDKMGVTDLYSTENYGIISQEIGFDGLFSQSIKGRKQ